MTGASQGPDGRAVLKTKASAPKWKRPIMQTSICIWYHDASWMWYAAYNLTIPTAMFQVPNVLAPRGVTGESSAPALARAV